MTYKPTRLERDSGWRMIQPGLYIDPDGCGHVFPDEICAELGWPYDAENYRLIVEALRRILPTGMPLRIVQHERKPDA